jgi:hypothetical protein
MRTKKHPSLAPALLNLACCILYNCNNAIYPGRCSAIGIGAVDTAVEEAGFDKTEGFEQLVVAFVAVPADIVGHRHR